MTRNPTFPTFSPHDDNVSLVSSMLINSYGVERNSNRHQSHVVEVFVAILTIFQNPFAFMNAVVNNLVL